MPFRGLQANVDLTDTAQGYNTNISCISQEYLRRAGGHRKVLSAKSFQFYFLQCNQKYESWHSCAEVL